MIVVHRMLLCIDKYVNMYILRDFLSQINALHSEKCNVCYNKRCCLLHLYKGQNGMHVLWYHQANLS